MENREKKRKEEKKIEWSKEAMLKGEIEKSENIGNMKKKVKNEKVKYEIKEK